MRSTVTGNGAVCSAMVLATITTGCVRRLPPAPTPPPVAPHVEAAAPPPTGYGRLVVDVVDGPAPVERVAIVPEPVTFGSGRQAYELNGHAEPLCATTPCAIDLPLGNHMLRFPILGRDAREVELVHVGPDPSVYRRALSMYGGKTGATRTWGILSTSFGGAALVTGVTLLPIGLANDNNGLTTAGGISLGAGTLLLTLGILAIRADSPWFRPGAANHFPLAAPP